MKHTDETDRWVPPTEEGLYYEVLNHMSEGVLLSEGSSGRILYANPGLERLLGVGTKSLVGRALEELSTPGNGALHDRMRAEMQRVGNWLGEMERPRGDGTTVWTSTSVTRVEPEGCEDRGPLWVSIIQELGRPHARDRVLRVEPSEVESMYDAIADAVFAVHMPSREIRYVNRAVLEMFGYAREEVLGSSTRMFYADPDEYEAFGARLHQAFLAGEPQVRAEHNLRTKDGRAVRASIVTTFMLEGGQLSAVVSVVRDVTRERMLEERLEHVKKMESLGQLAGGVAHDMNNVLAAIMAMGELLLEECESSRHADLQKILDAATRGKVLVENLLGFARKGDYAKRPLAIDEQMRSTLAMLERTLPKSIHIDSALGAPGTFVVGDAAQLSQTLVNLCLNARDALGEGGGLRLRSERVTLAGHEVEGLAAGDYYQMTVEDDGQGMSAEVLARVYEPFFTTKDVGQGSGLGLAMAYGVLDKHGGAIRIRSAEGEGTTVTYWLPVANAPAEAATGGDSRPARASGRLRVLVVDDEAMLRDLLTQALRRAGHEVLTAACGEEAVGLFEARASSVDVVLLDMSMPEMSGGECFARLQAVDPRVRVVICTGHGETEVAQHMVEHGALAVLRKPFRLPEMLELLDRVAGGSSPSAAG